MIMTYCENYIRTSISALYTLPLSKIEPRRNIANASSLHDIWAVKSVFSSSVGSVNKTSIPALYDCTTSAIVCSFPMLSH